MFMYIINEVEFTCQPFCIFNGLRVVHCFDILVRTGFIVSNAKFLESGLLLLYLIVAYM